MNRTVIVGGGIAGLATAALLAAEGHDVTVCEELNEVGGRAGSWERDGFRFDTGPSWYLMPGCSITSSRCWARARPSSWTSCR